MRSRPRSAYRAQHGYASSYPDVQVRLVEAIGWSDIAGMIERGDIHLGQILARAIRPDDRRFATYPLEALTCWRQGKDGRIEIGRLAGQPLLLLDQSYIFRRNFDAACRLAAVQPNVAFESRMPHTLLAMAESGYGVAIIPSALRTNGYKLQIAGVSYRASHYANRSRSSGTGADHCRPMPPPSAKCSRPICATSFRSPDHPRHVLLDATSRSNRRSQLVRPRKWRAAIAPRCLMAGVPSVADLLGGRSGLVNG
jgi:LysR substrate binding domain